MTLTRRILEKLLVDVDMDSPIYFDDGIDTIEITAATVVSSHALKEFDGISTRDCGNFVEDNSLVLG